LDVQKDGTNSIKIPIEVRSKKIDYFNQYSAMIADLSQHALSLIFEVNSPLYQEFELDYRQKETAFWLVSKTLYDCLHSINLRFS
jgi:predicted component of viral defense system (DUF524 family)